MRDVTQRWKSTKETHKQLIKYLVVGGSSAIFEIVLFTVLLRAVLLDIAASNITAVLSAAFLNFFLNRTWSFHSTVNVNRSLLLYALLFLFNISFSTLGIHLLVRWGLLDVLAKTATMAAITCWNFILYRKVVFVAPSQN